MLFQITTVDRHFCVVFLVLLIGASAFSQPVEQTTAIRFREVRIAAEAFESVDVFDVDGDGVLDLVSGSFWYKGPAFQLRYFIGDQPRYYVDYYDDFSTIPMDVNEDGRMDFITGGWWGKTLRWKENPGKDTVWKEHVLAVTGNVETTRAWDVDSDGVPEIVPNTPGSDLVVYKKQKGSPRFAGTTIFGPHGHGLGFGDVNGDGRGDFILANGWLEAPPRPFQEKWTLHKEFNLGTASVPILVVDVNKDGLNDLIVGQAHDYGLHWYRQQVGQGKRTWTRQAIDTANSQFHVLMWVDIDNNGEAELVTEKRYRAHNEKDPGSLDPGGLYYYKWDSRNFQKQVISYGAMGEGKGTGIYFSVVDLDRNGWKDIVVAGKDGLSVFYNQGKQ